MSSYLLIESRDPFESRDTQFLEQLALALRRLGHQVTVFLVQNAVLATRKNASRSGIGNLSDAGVNLLADDFSLCERGIEPADLRPGVQPAGIDLLVDALVKSETKAIWH